MELTKRQCWKVIRDLVVEKNKEYSSFLLKVLDISQSKELQGYTRDAFLSQFGFYSLDAFYEHAISQNNSKESNSRWLENLSSEDLLLFLDFRCKILQGVYDFYRKNRQITKHDIKDIVNSTKISGLASANLKMLKCGSKPARIEGELKNSQLNYTSSELKEQALSQTIGGMANKLISKNIPVDKVEKYVSHIRTSNITIVGEITGYKLKNKIKLKSLNTENDLDEKNYNDGKMHFIGYDEKFLPVFILDGEYVNFFKSPVPESKVIYDEKYNLISDMAKSKAKHVGFDIHGSPVYECENGYYTSTGRMLEDDEYIESIDNDEEYGL